MSADAVRVAVIGGGCAGMAAAFELTRPEHGGRYEVTVYQQGWRLGGKGASGRGPRGRIEEHGLHLWLGCYENAFRLVRECYAELRRDPNTHRFADWSDVFYPDPIVGLADQDRHRTWEPWLAFFPPTAGLPGDPAGARSHLSVAAYTRRAAALAIAVLESMTASATAAQGRTAWPSGYAAPTSAMTGEGTQHPRTSAAHAADLQRAAIRWLRLAQLGGLTALIEGARLLDRFLRSVPVHDRQGDSLGAQLAEALVRRAKELLGALLDTDDEVRRAFEILDLVLAYIRGALRSGLLTDPRGFDALDDYDAREWFRLHGASERTLGGAFVRSLYDLAFACVDGDSRRPRMSAAIALRGAARMFFSYRGSLFWKMRTGMGDAVFAPLYEVLRQRGAQFRFFHRLVDLRVATNEQLAPGERSYVRSMRFLEQARTHGNRPYEPLIDVRGVACWPSLPRWEQLEDGEALADERAAFENHWDHHSAGEKELLVNRDFDAVVLAVPVAVLPYACAQLLQIDERWRTMVERVKTTPTQAFQLWLRADLETLGWPHPPVNLTGFVDPFDTWADMSQLIAEEDWQGETRSIAYFCNVLSDDDLVAEGVESAGVDSLADPQERARARVIENVRRFLADDIVALWPGSRDSSGGFRWDLLVAPEAAEAGRRHTPEELLATQYFSANVSPSDRYVLSLPGSTRHRISPLDNTYDNLTIAGDWTENGYNAGCVEAAVMSGRLAAHAISGHPRLEEIVGYDHP